MQNINTYISERLVLSKNKTETKHTLFPKTVRELKEMIKEEVKKNGTHCSLNHIDIYRLQDLDDLFMYSDFD